jgi:hypothetical protein
MAQSGSLQELLALMDEVGIDTALIVPGRGHE